MGELEAALISDSKRPQVVEDCVTLVAQEVADKKGLSGMAIKTGYKMVKGFKPGFLPGVIEDMLPEFASALEPIYQEAKGSGGSVAQFFEANPGRVADALLGITDARAQTSKNALVKSTYQKLRGTAKTHVEAAVPRLAALIQKYV